MADDEVNRALAESYIARSLGFGIVELRDRNRPLSLPRMANGHFKRYKNEIDDRVRASALVAQTVAAVVVRAVAPDLPDFAGPRAASDIRSSILRENVYVDLGSLLDYCWQAGIVVIPVAQLPGGGKRFDGLAAFIEGRPVIILASGREEASRWAFYLAHELGHVMLKHVRPESKAWVDGNISGDDGTRSSQEKGADRFACEVLTGYATPEIPDLKKNAVALAFTAAQAGPRQGIDPGVYTLIYAKSNDRWGVAQNALKRLGLDKGGRNLVAEELSRRLAHADLVEADERLLGILQAA